AVLESGLLPAGELDVLLTTTSFSTTAPTRSVSKGRNTAPSRVGLGDLDVPVLQAIFCSSSENVWAANVAGLPPRAIAMNVPLPLDTHANQHDVLDAPRAVGYAADESLPPNRQPLDEALIAPSLQDLEFATAAAYQQAGGALSAGRYSHDLQQLPEAAQKSIT